MAIIVKPHVHLSWGGVIGTPAIEVFTNSLNFTGVTDSDSESYTRDGLAAMIPEIKTALVAWFTAPSSLINLAAQLTWIKLNKIGVAGTYLDAPLTVEFAPIPGGASSNQLWQQSQVISLRTGAVRGRGSRGRMYPPVCGGAPSPTTGYIIESLRASMQANAVKLLGDLNKILGPDNLTLVGSKARWNACIVSNANGAKLPLLTPITSLYVDGIPDVQRRRVNRIPVIVPASTSVYLNT